MTLDLSPERKDMLRALAEEHELFIGRGKMHDVGSIQKLIEKIADGELKVVPLATWRKTKDIDDNEELEDE
jgi:hypothetical protein